MSAFVECPHGDDPYICPPCQRPAPPAPIAWRRIVAGHPGRCRGCGSRIVPGDDLVLADDGWVCADCGGAA